MSRRLKHFVILIAAILANITVISIFRTGGIHGLNAKMIVSERQVFAVIQFLVTRCTVLAVKAAFQAGCINGFGQNCMTGSGKSVIILIAAIRAGKFVITVFLAGLVLVLGQTVCMTFCRNLFDIQCFLANTAILSVRS